MYDAHILAGLPNSDPERARCGYRLRQSCANCEHVVRCERKCLVHGFNVNMDRGICNDFVLIGGGKKRRVKRMEYAKVVKALAVAAALAFSTGCLSVARVSKCGCSERWSEERQEYVRVEPAYGNDDFLGKFGLYPTMQMRWQLMRLSWNWSPPRYYWQRRVGIPVAQMALLPGGVVDLVVDTVSLPWDWKYRGNSVDLVSEEYPERIARSSCVSCGRLSEGEFALCRCWADQGTDRCNKRYGVCRDCIPDVGCMGYYFED